MGTASVFVSITMSHPFCHFQEYLSPGTKHLLLLGWRLPYEKVHIKVPLSWIPVIMGACVRGFYVPYVADELHCCTYRPAIFYVGITTTWHIPASGKTTVEGIFTTDEHTAQKSARGLIPSSLSFRLLPLSIVVLFLKPLANPMVCFARRSAVGPS